MAIYTGIDCPVCGEKFKDGEDIVTCPVCGTPSHRACYEKIGRCPNAGKHSGGFEFKVEKPKEEDLSAKYVLPPLETNSAENQPATAVVPAVDTPNVNVEDIRVEPGDSVGGEATGSISAVIKKKIPFYISKFKKLDTKKGKISWNLAAIIFGPYWYFYRRMSKVGTYILGLEVVANAFVTTLFRDSFITFSTAAADIYEQVANTGGVATQEMIDTLNRVVGSTKIVHAFLINIAIIAVIRIVSGLLGNNFYKDHCVKLVKLAKDNVDAPELAVRLQSIGYAVKSKKDVLYLYLSQMGGTSFFGVLTGYLGYMIVTQFVAMFL